MRFYEADLNNDISEIVEEYINYSFPKDLENVKSNHRNMIFIILLTIGYLHARTLRL